MCLRCIKHHQSSFYVFTSLAELFAPSTQALVLTAFLWPLTVLQKLNTAFPECAGKVLPFEKSSD